MCVCVCVSVCVYVCVCMCVCVCVCVCVCRVHFKSHTDAVAQLGMEHCIIIPLLSA